MFEMDKRKKTFFIVGICGFAVFTIVAFALLTTTLSLNFGDVTSNALVWDVGFVEGTVTGVEEGKSGAGLLCDDATVTSSSVSLGSSKLSKPGDKCIYSIKIKNKGEIPATISSIVGTEPNGVSCTKNGSTMVCDKITYQLSTASGANLVTGVTINEGETYDFRLVIRYSGSMPGLETTTQSGAKFTISYTQSSEREDTGSELPEGVNGTVLNNYKDFIATLTNNAPNDSTDMIGDTLFYDGTADNNLRYVGKNPNNYVTFNDEVAGWRIVGFFNNVDDGIGNKTTRIKLVRSDYIGTYTYIYGNNNDWVNSPLPEMLNEGAYYTRSTQLYNGSTKADFNSIGLLASSKPYIDDAVWYLGGHDTPAVGAKDMYEYERSSNVYDGNSTKWTGKIALIYPSDFGFASKDCRTGLTNMSVYNDSGCYTTDWISSMYGMFTITPLSNNSTEVFGMTWGWNNVFNSRQLVSVSSKNSGYYKIFPSFYLKSTVKISGGSGTQEDPYTLSY